MKILTISNYYPEHPGGVEFVALNLVREWRQRHSVRWMACDVSTHPHRSEKDDIPLPALNFTEEKLGFPYPLPWPKGLSQILEQVQWSEVVHLHDCLYAANVLAFLAALYYRKPTVITQHVGPVPYAQKIKIILQSIAYNTIGRYLIGYADHVVFISQQVKDWFDARFKYKGQTHLIPNGINRSLFYPAQEDEKKRIRNKLGIASGQFVLLFVGRFTEKKGLHVLRDLATARPNLLWVLVGQGELDPSSWLLQNVRVVLMQSQASLRSFYVSADVFVLPSVGEGFPLSVQEAMACGLPVCVSRATADILPDAPLIPLEIKNLPAMLDALDTLQSSVQRRKIISELSVEYAKRWDWEQAAIKYEFLFSSLTEKGTKKQ